MILRCPIAAFLLLLLLSIPGSSAAVSAAVTLKALREVPHMTPELFAGYFADFKFKTFERLQKPETFLATRTGDCDDFAVLAASILGERGYTTRLIVVFMPRDIHVVCYVMETRSYLDYNNRRLPMPTVRSTGVLADIAGKVARSFKADWYCVSEFVVERGERVLVDTDFPRTRQAEGAIRHKGRELAER
jgi:hypothetical protein